MLQFTVPPADGGKRLDRFLFSKCTDLPGSVLLKAFRKKDVKVNGKRTREDVFLSQGDVVTVYIPEGNTNGGEEPSERKKQADGTTTVTETARTPAEPFSPIIAYEDDALLVVVKPQGIAVQENDPPSGRAEDAESAGELPYEPMLQDWWDANREPLLPGFPALCHRLDRNTGGLLMFAKSEEALTVIGRHIRKHRIRKIYQCIVVGTPEPRTAEIEAWLEKDAEKGRVYVHEHAKPGALPIRTKYRVLETDGIISRVQVEIITGRTHQIRAQLARIGHPILGDPKYGSNQVNRRYKIRRQALWACRLEFDFPPEAPLIEAAGKTIEWKDIPWEAAPERKSGLG